MLPDEIASPRLLTFPTDEPIGWIDVQPWQPQDVEPWLLGRDIVDDSTEWHRIGAAQGKMHIPAGMAVRLRLNRRAKLSSLQALEAHSIQDLFASWVPVEDKDLQHLSHLRGLRTLDLWDTHVSPQGWRYLESLQSLEHFAWCDGGQRPKIELAPLAQLTGLKGIWLSPDGLDGEQLRYLADLPHLRNLRLFDVYGLDDLGWLHLSKLSTLRFLSFWGGAVSRQALIHISQLIHLETLEFNTSESVDGNGFIYLETLKNIKKLYLYQVYNGIENSHLASLQRWPALERIGLGYNDWLDGVGLGHLAAVPKLRWLDIAGDFQTSAHYSRHAMQQLEMASGLELLGLSNIEVEPGGLQSLKKLPHLRDLDLSATNVTDDDLEALDSLTQLETLDLTHAAITDKGLSPLAGLTQLEELHLEDTLVNGTGLHMIAGLTGLHTLELGCRDKATPFEADSVAQFTGNPIQVLSISHGRTPIRAAIEPFPALRRLSLFGMSLSAEDARQIELLSQLRFLNLSYSSIGLEVIEAPVKLDNLQILYLSGSVISEAAVRTLGKLRQLEELSLSGTSINENSLAELRESLPNCQVFGN